MKINKKTILSVVMGIGIALSSTAQNRTACTWPTEQILPNGDFECNDYTSAGEHPLFTLHDESLNNYYEGIGNEIGEETEQLSMWGWHQYSFISNIISAWGYYTGAADTPTPYQGTSAVKLMGPSCYLYRATDAAKPMDPAKYYKISAWIKEEQTSGESSLAFSPTANPMNLNFSMVKVDGLNADGVGFDGPCYPLTGYCTPPVLPGGVTVTSSWNGWYKLETDVFQVAESGQYWFTSGYFGTGMFSADLFIDDIVLEEACSGIPAEATMTVTEDHACAAYVPALCQTTGADGHVFLTYESDAAGNITGPAYTTSWFLGDISQIKNFADLTFTPVNSGDPVFPGFMPGNHYGVKVGTGNCSGIWVDDAATVYINSNSSVYFYPTSTQSDATALLHVDNYGGGVDAWQVSYDAIAPTVWTDLSSSSSDQYTATGITSKRHYRARIACGTGVYYSNYRTLDVYSAPGGGRRTPMTLDNSMKLDLYPNPATSEVVIQTKDVTAFTICNSIGQVMTTVETNGTSTVTLDISKWAKGVYLVKWEGETETNVVRFIKE